MQNTGKPNINKYEWAPSPATFFLLVFNQAHRRKPDGVATVRGVRVGERGEEGVAASAAFAKKTRSDYFWVPKVPLPAGTRVEKCGYSEPEGGEKKKCPFTTKTSFFSPRRPSEYEVYKQRQTGLNEQRGRSKERERMIEGLQLDSRQDIGEEIRLTTRQ